jgi:aldose 1-epimerase
VVQAREKQFWCVRRFPVRRVEGVWGGALLPLSVIAYGLIVMVLLPGRTVRAGLKSTTEDLGQAQTTDETKIVEFTLRNRNGMTAKIINYGATLRELWVPDHHGKLTDVVLGFDDVQGYLGRHPHFGGTIGRYANRIAKGQFTLDGKTYQLALNNGPNSLHGGMVGFDHRAWKGEQIENAQGVSVRFTYVSKDGEENFPGTLTTTVMYTLTDENELKLEYTAETDKSTPLNLTNHTYFNLTGSGDVLGHVLYLNADEYTPTDDHLIPTGELRSVEGTPLDFRKPTAIGVRIGKLKEVGGYDHNFVVKGTNGTLRLAATVKDPKSGRKMEVWTTEPGIQFYSAVHLDGVIGKGGVAYQKYGALCLETQHYPDSPNHANFPSTILTPDARFHSQTIYKFLTK